MELTYYGFLTEENCRVLELWDAIVDIRDKTHSKEWVWTPRGGYYLHKSPKWGVAWQTRT